MLDHLLIYILSFGGIWMGSGLAVGAVGRIAKSLHISSFVVSFLVLGFFTSMSEISVGINALLLDDPEIYVGNLIGASIVIFMLIIPLLAVSSKGIKITKEFRGFNLPLSLMVVALPVVLAMDGIVGKVDSVVALLFFGFLVMAVASKKGLVRTIRKLPVHLVTLLGKEILKVIGGVLIIFLASTIVVKQTLYFSQMLDLSPFIISLLVIGIGTNIPELSLVVRSVFMKNNQVAFGDYVGSASFNTFLLGGFTLISGKEVSLTNSYLVSLSFLVIGLLLFYYFARTKNTISRGEGMFFLGIYMIFVLVEVYFHRGVFL